MRKGLMTISGKVLHTKVRRYTPKACAVIEDVERA